MRADLTVYLTGLPPRDRRVGPGPWVAWPDFGVPLRPRRAAGVLRTAHAVSTRQRVEVVCGGGRGRTGTALACLAVCDGMTADEAVRFVRSRYHPRAVETPWQRRFVHWFHDQGLGR